MERIWLPIAFVHAHSFSEPEKPPRSENKDLMLWFTLDLGTSLRLIGYNLYYEPGKQTGWFGQNYVSQLLRLVDVPFAHRNEPVESRDPMLLRDRVSEAVHELCYKKHGDAIRSYFEGTEPAPTLPAEYVPESWPTGRLEIPVDYLQVSEFFSDDSGIVYAQVRVGHHVICWEQKVFDGLEVGLQSNVILDPGIIQMINQMLQDPERQAQIRKLSERRDKVPSLNYTEMVPDCDLEGVPPPIEFR